MKIEILSMQQINNMGSLLQAYGLMKRLKGGHNSVHFLDIKKYDDDYALLENDQINFNKEYENDKKYYRYFRYPISMIYQKMKVKQQNKIFEKFRNNYFYRADEDKIYDFLTNDINYYMKKFEVLATDNFKAKEITKPKIGAVGVRVENNLLEIDMDKLNIDLSQLEDILQKYKLKKKYYRLKDGSFLDLQESNEIDFIDKLISGTDVDYKELESGTIRLPVNRTLYLNQLLKEIKGTEIVKNKEYKLPFVIPIVLYTGKKKWDAKRYLEESQETLDGVKMKAGNYNLVDINDFTKEELLQEKTLISKMMLLEKSESTEESIEMLEKIIPNTNKEEKELLKRVISILFGEKIGEEKTKELIEKINGGDGKMLAVVDMIRNENQMYINMGRKEGRKEERKIRNIEIAQKLLKLKMPITQISEVTELTEKEIKALKQS